MTKNQGYGVCKEEENNMKRKFLSLALCLMMVLSFMVVPASAEGEVTLLESWFENTATSEKVYDTLAEATVKPAFYVNNETGAAIEGAKLVLASYDASGKLASVNYTAAPTIATGESKVTTEESINVSQGGETYMMIWDTAFAPVVDKVELTTDSRQAEILSFVVDGTEGKIKEEQINVTRNSVSGKANDTISKAYAYKKEILVSLPYTSTLELTAITPVITPSTGATVVAENGLTEQDFSEGKAVNYVVTAADGKTTATYSVKVEKMERLIYNEYFGSSFPVIDYNAIVTESKTSFTYETITDGVTPYQGSVTTNKIGLGATPDKGKLYYNRKDYNAGNYVLRTAEGEKFSEWYRSDGTTLVSADINGTEPADTDRAYVLDKNENYVLSSDLVLVSDPVNPDNYCVRYEKRGSANVDGGNFRRGAVFQSSTNNMLGSGANRYWYGYGKLYSKLSYSVDVYIPENLPVNNCVRFQLEPTADKDSIGQGYGFEANNATGDIVFNVDVTDTNVIDIPLCKINDALGEWVNIKFDLDYTGTKTLTDVYVNNKFVGHLDFTMSSAFTAKVGSAYNRYIWGAGASGQASRGTLYIDNVDMQAIYPAA